MLKIIEKYSYDVPPKKYYKIQETVTPQGHYIDLPESFNSRENAEKYIENNLNKGV